MGSQTSQQGRSRVLETLRPSQTEGLHIFIIVVIINYSVTTTTQTQTLFVAALLSGRERISPLFTFNQSNLNILSLKILASKCKLPP